MKPSAVEYVIDLDSDDEDLDEEPKQEKTRQEQKLISDISGKRKSPACSPKADSSTHDGARQSRRLSDPSYKSFACDVCGKSFNFKFQLLRHKELHYDKLTRGESTSAKVREHRKSSKSRAQKRKQVKAAVSMPEKSVELTKKPSPDPPKVLDDPRFLTPLERGWTRLVIYRRKEPSRCDIYYNDPNGKRFRSLVQLAKTKLSNGLTVKNFTFSHNPLDLLHPNEVVRHVEPEVHKPIENVRSQTQKTKIVHPLESPSKTVEPRKRRLNSPEKSQSPKKQRGSSQKEAFPKIVLKKPPNPPSKACSEESPRSEQDETDDKYLRPLKNGWTRLVVGRRKTTVADIYYVDEEGTKFRSLNELKDYKFRNRITVENFTFKRCPLAIKHPREIVLGTVPISRTTPPTQKPQIQANQERRKISPSSKIRLPKAEMATGSRLLRSNLSKVKRPSVAARKHSSNAKSRSRPKTGAKVTKRTKKISRSIPRSVTGVKKRKNPKSAAKVAKKKNPNPNRLIINLDTANLQPRIVLEDIMLSKELNSSLVNGLTGLLPMEDNESSSCGSDLNDIHKALGLEPNRLPNTLEKMETDVISQKQDSLESSDSPHRKTPDENDNALNSVSPSTNTVSHEEPLCEASVNGESIHDKLDRIISEESTSLPDRNNPEHVTPEGLNECATSSSAIEDCDVSKEVELKPPNDGVSDLQGDPPDGGDPSEKPSAAFDMPNGESFHDTLDKIITEESSSLPDRNNPDHVTPEGLNECATSSSAIEDCGNDSESDFSTKGPNVVASPNDDGPNETDDVWRCFENQTVVETLDLLQPNV